MASITIRKLEDSVKTKLRIRAAENGRSMEEEVRQILRSTVDQNSCESEESLDRRIAAMSEPERWIELEKQGIVVPAKDPDTRMTPGERYIPGALDRFLADR